MKRLCVLFIIVVLAGCIGQVEREPGGLEGKIVQKGSDTMVITAQRWAEIFMTENPGVTIEISGGGSGTGISALINGTTDLADASRAMSAKELGDAESKGIGVLEIRAAIDGISIVVNPSNPITDLTSDQLKGIFTGRINNWKELGWEDHEIIMYGRQSSSGTYVYFKEDVLEKEDYSSKVQELSGSAALAEAVSRDRYGIAYLGVGYVRQRSDVKVIAINGIMPTQESILSGEYPMSRYLFIYFDKVRITPVVMVYLKWILSPKGQRIVEETGYDSLPQNIINEELAKLG